MVLFPLRTFPNVLFGNVQNRITLEFVVVTQPNEREQAQSAAAICEQDQGRGWSGSVRRPNHETFRGLVGFIFERKIGKEGEKEAIDTWGWLGKAT